jgi:uncharacterized membrane protein YgdD (TMEM256/DUF423 family)
MQRKWIFIAAINGLIAVAAGAFAAHGLKDSLDAKMLDTFEVGARYQMYHALAIAITAAAWQMNPGRARVACWAFLIGILLFTGSLYALALSGVKFFAYITPFGGVSFLVGWAALAAASLPFGKRESRTENA